MSLVLALGEKQKWLSTAAVYHCLELIGSETLSPSHFHATLFWHTTLRSRAQVRYSSLLHTSFLSCYPQWLTSMFHSLLFFSRLSTECWVSVSKFELIGLVLRILHYVQALLVILSNAEWVSSIISLVSS